MIFFFNGTATTEIYTLSLHDALPIYVGAGISGAGMTPLPRAANEDVGMVTIPIPVAAVVFRKVLRLTDIRRLQRLSILNVGVYPNSE